MGSTSPSPHNEDFPNAPGPIRISAPTPLISFERRRTSSMAASTATIQIRPSRCWVSQNDGRFDSLRTLTALLFLDTDVQRRVETTKRRGRRMFARESSSFSGGGRGANGSPAQRKEGKFSRRKSAHLHRESVPGDHLRFVFDKLIKNEALAKGSTRLAGLSDSCRRKIMNGRVTPAAANFLFIGLRFAMRQKKRKSRD